MSPEEDAPSDRWCSGRFERGSSRLDAKKPRATRYRAHHQGLGKEGFVECLRTNTTLVRRRIRDPRLRIEEYELGRISWTKVAVLYIEGLVNEEVLGRAAEAGLIALMWMESAKACGHIEELTRIAPFSPFPTIFPHGTTRSGDGDWLLEGRIAILTDGTPFVPHPLPATFTMFFTTSEITTRGSGSARC